MGKLHQSRGVGPQDSGVDPPVWIYLRQGGCVGAHLPQQTDGAGIRGVGNHAVGFEIDDQDTVGIDDEPVDGAALPSSGRIAVTGTSTNASGAKMGPSP